MKKFISVTFVVLVFLSSTYAKEYFLNSLTGNDDNTGTTEDTPWQSLKPIQDMTFSPGDIVNFACGSQWKGELVIASNGTKEDPIIFKSYGQGNKPIISNPAPAKYVVDIAGSWVVLDGLLLKDSHNAALHVSKGANHNVVQNCEMTNAGMGVGAYGKYNLFTRNFAHDLHIIKNTPRNINADDDYGAVAFWMFAPCNEISYNRGVNCRAPSYDYGHDGGFFEIFGNGDSSYVHHNYAENCEGFHESGGGSSKGVVMSYNIAVENNGFICLHLGKGFHSEVENMRVENNTVISSKGTRWGVLNTFCGGRPSPSTLMMRNNNFVFGGNDKERFFENGDFIHENNLYYLLNGASVGFDLGKNEIIANPNFVDFQKGDFHLSNNSPAIDAGLELEHTSDFEGDNVPSGKSPDIGAFEY
ncbi:MAG: hypothetical protein PF489_08235 [Salinivirgaceae bacterium]|nr:hypothetical protein [Salinivirgaceae bacterium]